eukprot:TRINITY_DN732_c0_g1_i2.p1 TRINITY_DN732_c0_g1~~TRINITY_DN732_c0_g1_i2.p1  ORF type:complete len:648 (-),score=165.45 TRINITY_DN732_c0_g1_i2:80-2023(-)
MSDFSADEVKSLMDSGCNSAASEKFLSSMRSGVAFLRPPPGNIEAIRQFMVRVYIQKLWAPESMQSAARGMQAASHHLTAMSSAPVTSAPAPIANDFLSELVPTSAPPPRPVAVSTNPFDAEFDLLTNSFSDQLTPTANVPIGNTVVPTVPPLPLLQMQQVQSMQTPRGVPQPQQYQQPPQFVSHQQYQQPTRHRVAAHLTALQDTFPPAQHAMPPPMTPRTLSMPSAPPASFSSHSQPVTPSPQSQSQSLAQLQPVILGPEEMLARVLALQEENERLKGQLRMLEHCNLFKFSVLRSATNGFAADRIVGTGGFGKVYRGELFGSAIAVKKLEQSAQQGEHEFISEVRFLSRFRHRNIVPLIGCACDDNERCLVYEYQERGTLEQALARPPAQQLQWFHRVRIATEAARALLFLHAVTDVPLLHRDVNSANLLLDLHYTVRLGDFGLAMFALSKADRSDVMVATLGYVDPEYAQTGLHTPKTDVYCLGVVMLELLTSEPAHAEGRNPRSLVEAVEQRILMGATPSQIAVSCAGVWTPKVLADFWSLAQRCVQPKGEARPSMQTLVEELNRMTTIAMTDAQSADSGQQQQQQHHQAMPAQRPAVPAAVAQTRPSNLHADIQHLISADGKPYYYNTRTHVSSWQYPMST